MAQNPNSSTMWRSPVNLNPRKSKTGTDISVKWSGNLIAYGCGIGGYDTQVGTL